MTFSATTINNNSDRDYKKKKKEEKKSHVKLKLSENPRELQRPGLSQ